MFQRVAGRTIRKDQRCYGCLDVLSAGTRVTYVAGYGEGFYAMYLCGACAWLHRDTAFTYKYCDPDGLEQGEFGEMANEFKFESVAAMAAYWERFKTIRQ